MRRVRSLLALKNGKLGSSIYHFDLPAIQTCPGRSAKCEQVCYATTGRFVTDKVRNRLAWCYRQALRSDFVPQMVSTIRRVGVIAVRIHVSGDFFSPAYARKWLEIVRQCASVRFYAYTRSWRVARVAPILIRMAERPNCRLWYSTDEDTGTPKTIPAGVRLAYLQTSEESPEEADLIFRPRPLRDLPTIGLPMVCPQETDNTVNCGNCGHCWS